MVSSHLAFVLGLAAAAHALTFNVQAAKGNPVSKVVELLKDMKKDLEKEADHDEEVYEKLACWCETNDKGKTKAIKDAEDRLEDLQATILKMASLSETLKVEIKALEKEIAEDQKALETATAMREKAKAEFLAEEKEMIASIRALTQAVEVLSSQHGGKSASFLSSKVVVQAYATAKVLMDRHYDLLSTVITPTERHSLASFVQGGGPEGYLDAEPTFKQSYAPQSGQIFGILRQMKETFENDLSSGQKEEISQQEAFAELKKAKEEEIKAGQDSVDSKKQQLATADETLAQSREDQDDTNASLSADKKFLRELKVKCKMTDKEWEERQKIRQTELEGVSKAIEILSSDEAREQFTKSFNPGKFLQTSQHRQRRRDQAVNMINKVARKNPKFSALAISMRLDPFPKVKKAINDMVAQLQKEKEDEIKEKDFCTKELNKNTKKDAAKAHTKKRLDNKIAALEQAIKEQTEAIATLDAEIKELNDQRDQASKDRKAEKEAYEQEVEEQNTTIGLLTNALKVLKEVYSDVAEGPPPTEFLQKDAPPVGGPPPKDFAKYEKSRASAGIIGMIEQIRTDAQNMIKEAQHNEQNALDSFAKFVQTTNEGLAAKDDAKTDLVAQKAQSSKDLTAAKEEHKGTMSELEALAKEAGDLHKQCDFLLANFDTTQKARDDEVEALKGAYAFISGQKA